MDDRAPYVISRWRIALGVLAGTLATILLTTVTMFGHFDFGFARMAAVVAIAPLLLVVLPFVLISLRRGTLTVWRALATGCLMTGLPTLLYATFVMTDVSGDPYGTIAAGTLQAVVIGLIGTLVAWITAVGPRFEPPRAARGLDGLR